MNNTDHKSNDQSECEKLPLIKWGWVRAVLFIVGWFPVMFLVRKTKRMLIYGEDFIPGSESMFYGQLIKAAGFLLLVILLRKFIDRKSFVSLGFRFSSIFRRDLMVGVGAGFAMPALIFAVLYLTGSVKVSSIQFPVTDLLFLLGIFIVVGFREELVSRGYMLASVMGSMNRYWALLATSLLFASFHLDSPSITAFSFLNLVLGGIMLGVYYIHQRNLWFPIGLHFGWNFALGPVFGSAISGNTVPSILTLKLTGSDFLTGGEFGFEASILMPFLMILATVLVHIAYREQVSTSDAEPK